MWYSVHGDDYVGLGAEVDVEWYRQQVSKRFIMKLRGYLGPAAHHKREMCIQNRVFIWRSSEAGSAEMITYEGDLRHVDILLRDYGLGQRSVRKPRNQQGHGAADGQRRRNTEGTRQVQLHSVEAAVVRPATHHTF